MPLRDPAQYHEARTDPAEIDKIPELVAECIGENWNGRVPAKDQFVSAVSQLACVALLELFKRGKLAALTGSMPEIEDGKRLATHAIAEVIAARNPRMVAQCLDITFGLGIQGGRTQEDIGLEHGVCRATISGICTTLKETYTGKPGTGMKSNEAVEKYKRLRLGRRAKAMPAAWEFANLFQQEFANAKRRNKSRKCR